MSTLSNSYGFRENCDLISGSWNPGLQGIEREGGGGDLFWQERFQHIQKRQTFNPNRRGIGFKNPTIVLNDLTP